MRRRDEFSEQMFDALHEYREASQAIGQMICMSTASGAEWNAAILRQSEAMERWSMLPRLYADHRQ